MRDTLKTRLEKLEAKTKAHLPRSDLFARMARYEEIYEAMDTGLPLDADDPDVKTYLEYEPYFAELEAMRCRQIT